MFLISSFFIFAACKTKQAEKIVIFPKQEFKVVFKQEDLGQCNEKSKDISFFTFKFSSQQFIVTGRVAPLELVEKATSCALLIDL